MNDQIKLLAAGAAIGIAGAIAGGLVVAWAMCGIEGEGRRAKGEAGAQKLALSTQPSAFSVQRPIQISPSVFPTARGTNTPFRVSPGTNSSKRLLTSPPTGGMSFSAIQSVQNVPEVKQAREAAAEAQRRYFEVMKKAAEGRK